MQVKLLSYTKDPIEVIYSACRTCYSKESPIDFFDETTDVDLIKQVYKSGHLSTFEHVSFTFAIEGLSRACSHQLVRHRLCSYSQQSQRYVKFDNLVVYKPNEILKNQEANLIFDDFIEKSKENYKKLLDLGIKAEDARYILPNAACSNLVMTLNLRELIHICGLRLCARSQQEIRSLVKLMVDEVVKSQPWLKEYLVVKCEKDGFCKEIRSCGRKSRLKIENE